MLYMEKPMLKVTIKFSLSYKQAKTLLILLMLLLP